MDDIDDITNEILNRVKNVIYISELRQRLAHGPVFVRHEGDVAHVTDCTRISGGTTARTDQMDTWEVVLNNRGVEFRLRQPGYVTIEVVKPPPVPQTPEDVEVFLAS